MSDARPAFSLSPPFAAQFDRDGDGYIYRRAYTGAAIPVSADERDEFVRAFNRVIVGLGLGLLASVISLIVLTIRFAFGHGAQPFFWIVGGTSVVTIAGSLGFLFAWRAPDRALEGRDSVAPPLSRAEARRVGWSKMGWSQAVFAGFWAVFMASRGVEGAPPVAPWVWFSLAGLSVAMCCAVVVMKLAARQPRITSPPG
jgi:hypothetical protein